MLHLEKSLAAFEEAKQLMPGGVNSPVRSYANVDCNPPFIARAEGDRIFDIDGNEYIDYVGSWGPMVVGHAHPNVVKALQEAVTRGTSYGAPTVIESELAKLVQHVYPSIELIRMVNSGTEATMSALRLARGYTGREKIVKFIGCYHGHSDSLLVSAGSGMATFGVPSSPGVTKGTAKDTVTVPYNDAAAIEKVKRCANRALAKQLLAAADLWLFVTTANRYADAVPWKLLEDAAGRDITVGVVLNRVTRPELLPRGPIAGMELLCAVGPDEGQAEDDMQGLSVFSRPPESPVLSGAETALVKLGIL